MTSHPLSISEPAVRQKNIAARQAPPICQKCGDIGFQEVMIFCKQCKKNCEHKYCLYKFPKKGEKVHWFCEECKPTIFPISSPNEFDVDTERSKIDLECTHTIQNRDQNQDKNQSQKIGDQPVPSFSHLAKVQEAAKSMELPPSDLKGKSVIFPISSLDKLEVDIAKDRSVSHTLQLEKMQEDAKMELLFSNLKLKPAAFPVSSPNKLEVDIAEDQSVSHISQFEKVQKDAKYMESLFSKLKLKPTTFPISSSNRLEAAIAENQSVTHISQLEKVQGKTRSAKPLSSDFGEIRQLKNRGRPVLSTKDQLDQNVPKTVVTYLPSYTTGGEISVHKVSVLGTIECWNSGCISFGDNQFVPFVAHGSTLAGEKVFDAAALLPPILPLNKYVGCDVYRKIFKKGPPTDSRIGLYILPDSYAVPELVARLIEDIIKKDLMFVYPFEEDNVEMLVFHSCILPEEHRQIQNQYYLWAGFSKKRLSKTVASADNYTSEPAIKYIENRKDIQEVPTCSESRKSVANVEKKHTENEEIDGNNSIPRIEKKNHRNDRLNITRVREDADNCSKNLQKYKQDEVATGMVDECIENHHDQAIKRKLADRSNEQSKGKQKLLQEIYDKSSQTSEKVCASSPIERYIEMQKLANESKNGEKSNLSNKKQKTLDGSKNAMNNRNEIHSNVQIKPAVEKPTHRYELRNRNKDKNEKNSSNPSSLIMEKQKAPYNLRKSLRGREENSSRASIFIDKPNRKGKT